MVLVFGPTARDPKAQSEGLGRSFAHYDLLFGLKGRDCGPSGLNLTFAARKNRPFGPGCRITSFQVEI